MLRLRGFRFSKESWPMVDLLDFNHKIKQQRIQQTIKPIDEQLGDNYNRYIQSSYALYYISHKIPTQEVRVLSDKHAHFKQTDRIFYDFDNLKRVRELESGNKHVLKEFEDSDIFPLDSMDAYKPIDFCGNLTDQQLILANIPLKATQDEIRQFVSKKTGQTVQVELIPCSLNLNALARITFNQEAAQFKQVLHLTRFNGILQECLSRDQTAEQNAFDRTLVISNLDRSLNFQDVLHHVAQYGRVINAVIPLEIENLDLPLLDDVLLTKEPVKLEILDVLTGDVEFRMHPSEQEFMKKFKGFSEYYDPDIAETVVKFQEDLDEAEDLLRQYRILTQKTIKCLKVPEHLVPQYRKMWLPHVNVEARKNIRNQLYNKTYKNRGYCLVTFSTKLQAQRALLALQRQSSRDLSQLAHPLYNQPEFVAEDNSHSKQEKYGGKFRMENLYMKPVKAIKAWHGIELYQVDLIYNLQQLEKVRRTISEVRDDAVNKILAEPNYDETNEVERREAMRDKVYQELNIKNDFKEMVEKQNFSQKLGQFESNMRVIPNTAPGRQFDLEVVGEHYNKLLNEFKQQAKVIRQKEKSYADEIVEKNQEVFLEDGDIMEVLEGQHGEEDELLHFLRQRVVRSYAKLERERSGKLDDMLDEIDHAEDQLEEIEIERKEEREEFREMEDKAEYFEEERKEAGGDNDKKIIQEFSTLITNPNYIKKQQLLKHDQFIDQLKRLILGEYKLEQEQPLIAVHPLNNSDKLTFKDYQGNSYITPEVVKLAEQFDVPEEQLDTIRKQKQNRQALLALIPRSYLLKIRAQAKTGLTKSLLYTLKYGYPSETYEIDANDNGQVMVDNLNKYVALNGEEYKHQIDPMTEKQYIIKTDKPYFKYDIGMFSDIKEDQAYAQAIQMIVESGKTKDQAKQLMQQLIDEDDIPEELLAMVDNIEIDDVEQAINETGLDRKQIETLGKGNLRTDKELIEQEFAQQAYLKSLQLKYGEETHDKLIRDHEKGGVRIKDKKGRFIVPKFKKY